MANAITPIVFRQALGSVSLAAAGSAIRVTSVPVSDTTFEAVSARFEHSAKGHLVRERRVTASNKEGTAVIGVGRYQNASLPCADVCRPPVMTLPRPQNSKRSSRRRAYASPARAVTRAKNRITHRL